MASRTYWYVDLENVHNTFAQMTVHMKQHDHIFIFYSAAADSMKISTYESIIRAMLHPHFIQVLTSGKNSMDFAIMVEMGRNSVLYPNVAHRCITNDTGFLAGVKHLRSYGVESGAVSPTSGEVTSALSKEERAIVEQCRVTNWSRVQRLQLLNSKCSSHAGPDGASISALYHKLKPYVE